MKVIQDYLPDETFTPPNPQTIAGPVGDRCPSLGGQSTDAAGAALRKAGLHPGGRPDGRQLLPAPARWPTSAPARARRCGTGSTVTIYVSDGTPYVAPQPPPQPSRTASGNGNGNGKGNGNGRKTAGGNGPRRALSRSLGSAELAAYLRGDRAAVGAALDLGLERAHHLAHGAHALARRRRARRSSR